MGRGLQQLLLLVLLGCVHLGHSAYVGLAPSTFRPGWPYRMQVTVDGAPAGQQVTVQGEIRTSDEATLVASGTATLNNGEAGELIINIPLMVPDSRDNQYKLRLSSASVVIFTNTTTISLERLTMVTFVQTDKGIYKPGQLVRFRVLTVDKDLVPQNIARTISVKNPMGSILARNIDNGTRPVFEGTYQITDFPTLGDWQIEVASEDAGIEEMQTFKVQEYVLPKFEVSAEVNPGFLLVGGRTTKVNVTVTATYTYGKGVMGDILIKYGVDKEVPSQITESSGMRTVAVNLSTELSRFSPSTSSNSRDLFIMPARGSIPLTVEVTDETGRTYNTTVTVAVELEPVKIEFDMSRTDEVFIPEMPFSFAVKVTDPTGQPLGSQYTGSVLTLSLNNQQNRTVSLVAGQALYTWDIAAVTLNVSSLSLRASLAADNRVYEPYSKHIPQYQTLGRAKLSIRWTNYVPVLTMGSSVSFTVDQSGSFSSLTYLMVSRGNIQAAGTAQVGENSVTVTTEMCPNGRLLVYGITTESEIIADSLDLKLDVCQNKKVTTSVPVSSQRTGTDADISVTVSWTDASNTQSVGQHDVFLLGVDKSILLLEETNDIDPATVEQQLGRFQMKPTSGGGGIGPRPWGISIPSSTASTNTGDLLQNLGLKVMADEAMKHREYFPIMYAFDNAPMAMMPRGLNKNLESPMDNEVAETAQGGAGTEVAANPVTVRRDFPETWIWMSTQTDANGQKTITKQLPDTITSWVISAFAIKDGTEIAVDPDPFNLNAFNPFFVSLNLPYSIRRGEKFELRATVFNYQNSEVSATVMLAKSDDDFIIAGEASQSVQVSSNGASSVNFMIEPLQIKTITLSVTATGSMPGGASMTDVLMKDLVVKPEGMERMNATTIPVMLNETMRQAIYTVPLDLSPYTQDDIVPGSRRAAVKITADMMGNAMDNIEKLVRQPTGCGEQNMITTVPNIFAMKYLEAIDDVREDFRTKAEGYMKLGFERETGDYRFTNGGYSAFGERSDESATTWLTAFVVKSFAQASRYVDIDQGIIQEDIAFILLNQNEDGSFNEPGKVIHTDMQGGAQNKEALSIYIYLALLEAQSYGWDVDQAKLDLSRSYLDDVVSGSKVQNQPFLAAITAYAVALSGDTSDGSTAQTVRNLVQYVKDQGTPWMEEEEEPVSSSPGIMPRRSTSGASKTEITAYCLLAYNLVDELVEARAMAMYLQTKQNSFGGYGNTQDTVMALQAISEYAARFSQVTPDSRVEVTPNGGPTQFRTLTAANGILLQIIELPDDTDEVQINVTGAPGTLTVVKVVWFFYTRPDSTRDSSTSGSGQPKLRLTSNTAMVRPSLYRTRMCINADREWDYNSMVVLMVEMPTGIQLEDRTEASKQPKVQRLEVTENTVNIYMDKPEDVCQEYMMEKTVEVENQKPGAAQVYAYYQSDVFSEAEIQLAAVCPPQGCPCTGDNCDSSHGNAVTSLSGLLLAACVCLLLSLALAV